MESTSFNSRSRGNYSRITNAQKESLIKLYYDGESISSAAVQVGVNIKTAFNIIKRYKDNDCEMVVKKRGGCRTKKLTSTVLEMIEKEVESNPGVTIMEIQKRLSRENINISKSTVDNGLKELKINRKLVSCELERLNSPDTLSARKEYALNFSQNAPRERKNIIFIGECEFNLHLRISQARSKKNTKDRRGRNITLIAAMNNEGIIHFKLITTGTCNSSKFCVFLRELIEKICDISSCWLLMDNAKLYKTIEVRNIINTSDSHLEFLCPHSPMLNPIEKAFSKIKIAVRNNLGAPGEHDLPFEIGQAINTITASDCKNWVSDMMMKLLSMTAKPEIF